MYRVLWFYCCRKRAQAFVEIKANTIIAVFLDFYVLYEYKGFSERIDEHIFVAFQAKFHDLNKIYQTVSHRCKTSNAHSC